jgi:hypothetical protein
VSNPQQPPPVPPGMQHKLAVILTLHRLRSWRRRVSKSRSSLHVTSHALAEARPSTKTAAAQLPGCRRNCQQQVGVTLECLPCRSSCLCDKVVISSATGASLRPCRHTGWAMADWLLNDSPSYPAIHSPGHPRLFQASAGFEDCAWPDSLRSSTSRARNNSQDTAR